MEMVGEYPDSVTLAPERKCRCGAPAEGASNGVEQSAESGAAHRGGGRRRQFVLFNGSSKSRAFRAVAPIEDERPAAGANEGQQKVLQYTRLRTLNQLQDRLRGDLIGDQGLDIPVAGRVHDGLRLVKPLSDTDDLADAL